MTIAQAHHWKELIDAGKFDTLTALGDAVDLDRSFTARIFRLTLLAPDIIEAILEGREPDGLSYGRLIEVRSVVWGEQRKRLTNALMPENAQALLVPQKHAEDTTR